MILQSKITTIRTATKDSWSRISKIRIEKLEMTLVIDDLFFALRNMIQFYLFIYPKLLQ